MTFSSKKTQHVLTTAKAAWPWCYKIHIPRATGCIQPREITPVPSALECWKLHWQAHWLLKSNSLGPGVILARIS